MSGQAMHSLTRRTWLAGLTVAGALNRFAIADERPHPPALPVPESLADALASALNRHQPLVVMVSLEGCPFCRVARENYLYPLYRREGLPVVQIDMRLERPVRDFGQAATTHDALIRSWGVRVAPTLLFFGAQGNEVAERLNGAAIADFYGAYLDQRLEVARSHIQ